MIVSSLKITMSDDDDVDIDMKGEEVDLTEMIYTSMNASDEIALFFRAAVRMYEIKNVKDEQRS